MDTKEQYIFCRDLIKNNETINGENRRQFLNFLSKVESLIFKPDSKRGVFNIHRWLKNATEKQSPYCRKPLLYINIDNENTVSTNGEVLNVYNGRLNGLPDGMYNAVTLEKAPSDIGTYPAYQKVFPKEYYGKFTFKIYDYSGGADDILEFRDDGIIYNSKLNKSVGTHTKEPTKNMLMLALGLISEATDKQKLELAAELGHDLNDKYVAPVKITGVSDGCYSFVMSQLD